MSGDNVRGFDTQEEALNDAVLEILAGGVDIPIYVHVGDCLGFPTCSCSPKVLRVARSDERSEG